MALSNADKGFPRVRSTKEKQAVPSLWQPRAFSYTITPCMSQRSPASLTHLNLMTTGIDFIPQNCANPEQALGKYFLMGKLIRKVQGKWNFELKEKFIFGTTKQRHKKRRYTKSLQKKRAVTILQNRVSTVPEITGAMFLTSEDTDTKGNLLFCWAFSNMDMVPALPGPLGEKRTPRKKRQHRLALWGWC